jgi:hypothetical protein
MKKAILGVCLLLLIPIISSGKYLYVIELEGEIGLAS